MIGHRPARVIGDAQQFGLTRADFRQPQNQFTGVVGIALLVTRPARGEQIVPGLAIGKCLQRRLLGGIGQRQQPTVVQAFVARGIGGGGNLIRGQSVKLV